MRAFRTLFACCTGRLQKQQQIKQLPAVGLMITRTIAATAASLLVFSSAGFGAVFAYGTGIEHGWLLAGLMVSMAISLECLKPLAVASALSAFGQFAIVRGLALSLLATVAVCYSLTSELSLVASTRGDLAARRASVIEQADNRHARIEAARSELKALAPSRPVAEVQAEITKQMADNPRAGDCSSLNGPASRLVCPTVATLGAEISRTERRIELQRTIAELTDAAPTITVKTADPASSALATYLAAIGITVPVGLLSEWLVLVPVLALEIGAALAVVLVQAVSAVQTTAQTAPQAEQSVDSRTETQPAQSSTVPASPVDRKKPATRPDAASKGQVRKRSGKRRLGQQRTSSKAEAEANVVDILKARGGRLDAATVRGVARLIGGSKSTAHNALAGLIAAGVVAKAGGALVLAAA